MIPIQTARVALGFGFSRWCLFIKILSSLMAWGNRGGSNSFLRLSEGKETPTKIQWDFFNRKALVRLPIQSQTAKGEIITPATVEFRLGDGSAHPHLLLAGIAQSFVHAYHMDDNALLNVVNRCRAVHLDKRDVAWLHVPRSNREVATVLESHKKMYVDGGVFQPSFIEQHVSALSSNRTT